MRTLLILLTAIFVVSCSSTTELPTAGTIETGETVNNPRQYDEFCERDVDNLCPEDE